MRALTAALAVCVSVPALAAGGWQDTPDALQLESVGDTVRMNGTPMTIRAFQSRQPVEALLLAVQANWERDPRHAPVVRTAMPNWIVLNQSVGPQHRSFQVRQNGAQAEGFVALTSPADTRPPVLALRMPPLVEALQVVDSIDQGRASQQIVAVSRRPADVTAVAFDQALKAEGWQRDVLKKQGGALRVSANRGSQQFDALLSTQKGGALVMINTVK